MSSSYPQGQESREEIQKHAPRSTVPPPRLGQVPDQHRATANTRSNDPDRFLRVKYGDRDHLHFETQAAISTKLTPNPNQKQGPKLYRESSEESVALKSVGMFDMVARAASISRVLSKNGVTDETGGVNNRMRGPTEGRSAKGGPTPPDPTGLGLISLEENRSPSPTSHLRRWKSIGRQLTASRALGLGGFKSPTHAVTRHQMRQRARAKAKAKFQTNKKEEHLVGIPDGPWPALARASRVEVHRPTLDRLWPTLKDDQDREHHNALPDQDGQYHPHPPPPPHVTEDISSGPGPDAGTKLTEALRALPSHESAPWPAPRSPMSTQVAPITPRPGADGSPPSTRAPSPYPGHDMVPTTGGRRPHSRSSTGGIPLGNARKHHSLSALDVYRHLAGLAKKHDVNKPLRQELNSDFAITPELTAQFQSSFLSTYTHFVENEPNAAVRAKLGGATLVKVRTLLLQERVVRMLYHLGRLLYLLVLKVGGVTNRGESAGDIMAEADIDLCTVLRLWDKVTTETKDKVGTNTARLEGTAVLLPVLMLSIRSSIDQAFRWLRPEWLKTKVGKRGLSIVHRRLDTLLDPFGFYSDLSVLQSHPAAMRILASYKSFTHISGGKHLGDTSPMLRSALPQPHSCEARRLLAAPGGRRGRSIAAVKALARDTMDGSATEGLATSELREEVLRSVAEENQHRMVPVGPPVKDPRGKNHVDRVKVNLTVVRKLDAPNSGW